MAKAAAKGAARLHDMDQKAATDDWTSKAGGLVITSTRPTLVRRTESAHLHQHPFSPKVSHALSLVECMLSITLLQPSCHIHPEGKSFLISVECLYPIMTLLQAELRQGAELPAGAQDGAGGDRAGAARGGGELAHPGRHAHPAGGGAPEHAAVGPASIQASFCSSQPATCRYMYRVRSSLERYGSSQCRYRLS